ncbi:MAG: hypothetical protein IT223_08055, partial [Crocinitomicaceae bacterium]|nr:hypothetical protein [Crocinitomicaceae bacterium]
RYIDFVGASFYVDGVEVISNRNWASEFSTTDQIFNNSTCTALYTNITISNYVSWRLYEVQPDPNMLPLWLSAGTTLKTSTPNIFLSVLEFDIIP